MIKNAMTPTEAFAFRLKHESEIKAIAGAVITTAVLTTLVLIVLSPILLPLWIVEKAIKGVK